MSDDIMCTPGEWAPPAPEGPHDHKGHSEEKCVRCGWVMGHQPLNCNNDDTPHVFPSQLADIDSLCTLAWALDDIERLIEWQKNARLALDKREDMIERLITVGNALAESLSEFNDPADAMRLLAWQEACRG